MIERMGGGYLGGLISDVQSHFVANARGRKRGTPGHKRLNSEQDKKYRPWTRAFQSERDSPL